MVFSTPIFIVIFLPITLILYYFSGRRNIVLLLASLFFYAWGEYLYTALLVLSIVCNYIVGLIIDRIRLRRWASFILFIGIAINLIILFHFKYVIFLVEIINPIIVSIGFSPFKSLSIHLPLGISFFTFQAITYLVDTYYRKVQVQKNILNLALYISLFPQLIAGPIVRYHEIAHSLKHRTIRLVDLSQGTERFVIGLSKKLILADTLAKPADHIFSFHFSELTSPLACFGALCFTLQIYFDFSGYSDMAIGFGRLFGFKFPENFNRPYQSKSIREFWHRWHMTLSRFFRDYLYIPMGGNRYGPRRTDFNLLIVFLLCGLWHGASLTFILWGFYHGFFLLIERTKFRQLLNSSPDFLRRIYVLLIVIFGWVLFRAPSVNQAMDYFKTIFSFDGWHNPLNQIASVANNYELFIFLTAWIFSTVFFTYSNESPRNVYPIRYIFEDGHGIFLKIRSISYGFLMGILFIISLGIMSNQTYKAFIYFRF